MKARFYKREVSSLEIKSVLKDPWVSLEIKHSINLNNQLAKELSPNHQLYKKPLSAIARNMACDDVLYQDGNTKHFYLIHLTWSKGNAVYPKYRMFPKVEDFIKYCNETFQFYE